MAEKRLTEVKKQPILQDSRFAEVKRPKLKKTIIRRQR